MKACVSVVNAVAPPQAAGGAATELSSRVKAATTSIMFGTVVVSVPVRIKLVFWKLQFAAGNCVAAVAFSSGSVVSTPVKRLIRANTERQVVACVIVLGSPPVAMRQNRTIL